MAKIFYRIRVNEIPQNNYYFLDFYVFQIIFNCAKELGHSCRQGGTMLTIEGPRFSSKAESKLWNSWGAHCVNMTTVPEVQPHFCFDTAQSHHNTPCYNTELDTTR